MTTVDDLQKAKFAEKMTDYSLKGFKNLQGWDLSKVRKDHVDSWADIFKEITEAGFVLVDKAEYAAQENETLAKERSLRKLWEDRPIFERRFVKGKPVDTYRTSDVDEWLEKLENFLDETPPAKDFVVVPRNQLSELLEDFGDLADYDNYDVIDLVYGLKELLVLHRLEKEPTSK